MKIKHNIILLLFSGAFLLSCDSILEEDISDRSVLLISPNEGSLIEGQTVHFQWATLDGADEYRIQVYGNANAQGIMLDSLVTKENFLYNMDPGEYMWRVRAENFAYHSSYTFPVNFSVEASDDLTEQSVLLTSPDTNFYTNETSITYAWQELNAATAYDFELLKNNAGSFMLVYQTSITENTHNVPEASYGEDAEYRWQVKAVNDFSETEFSERTLFLDTAVPNIPTLQSPADTSISNESIVSFSWQIGSDTGNVESVRSSVIQIAGDLNFNTILQEETSTLETIDITFNDLGTFYWRVKVVDLAGNESDYSTSRSFTLN